VTTKTVAGSTTTESPSFPTGPPAITANNSLRDHVSQTSPTVSVANVSARPTSHPRGPRRWCRRSNAPTRPGRLPVRSCVDVPLAPIPCHGPASPARSSAPGSRDLRRVGAIGRRSYRAPRA
jgi:hypothetical protein